MNEQTTLDFQPGDRLRGRYRLDEVVGRGGMGIVWRAVDEAMDDAPCAIKLVPPASSRDPQSVARLRREAERGIRLAHPHIVRVHHFDADEDRGGVAFFVMELVTGRSLADHLADALDGLDAERVATWARELASALDYAHGEGVLHRDINPRNVMIDEVGRARLLDFGIGAELRRTETRLTGLDASGTRAYMSPQQIRGEASRSNDVYALAVTVYEALSGDTPFREDGDVTWQILNAPVPSLKGFADEVDRVFATALAKSEEQRHPTATAFAGALAAALSGSPSPEAEPTTSVSEPDDVASEGTKVAILVATTTSITVATTVASDAPWPRVILIAAIVASVVFATLSLVEVIWRRAKANGDTPS